MNFKLLVFGSSLFFLLAGCGKEKQEEKQSDNVDPNLVELNEYR